MLLCPNATPATRAALAVLALSLMSFAPTGAAPMKAPAAQEQWTFTGEVLTDFPLMVGARLQVESPRGLLLTTQLGWMPGGFLDTVHDIAVAAEWYTQLTADLISAALDDAVLWRNRVGWRPWADSGFYFGGGYAFATLGGGLGSAELISAVTGTSLPPRHRREPRARARHHGPLRGSGGRLALRSRGAIRPSSLARWALCSGLRYNRHAVLDAEKGAGERHRQPGHRGRGLPRRDEHPICPHRHPGPHLGSDVLGTPAETPPLSRIQRTVGPSLGIPTRRRGRHDFNPLTRVHPCDAQAV